ncbi:hypothetical protein GVN18_32840 [Pseudomonas sp. ODNR1LW]|nr:hypothetical protein [Pseudomonas sp. ODNR1LW]
MRLAVLLATGAALVSGCNPTPVSIDPKECPAWRSVDYSKLPTHLNDDPQDPLFETIWTAWASEETGISWSIDTPQSTLHLRTAPGGLSTDPTVREVIGRGRNSSWEIYARSTPVGPPHPSQWTAWRRVNLTPSEAEKLNSILDDPCFWVAPRFLDGPVRLVNGRGDNRPDGPSTAYDVTHGERAWGGWHLSWTVGPQGRLQLFLLAKAFGLPEWPEDKIDDEGWFEWPP